MHLPKVKIVFLYSELASYNIACFNELSINYNTELHVVKMPLHPNAPFKLTNFHSSITFYDLSNFNSVSLTELLNSIKPQLVYCAGWINKIYLAAIKKSKQKFVSVLGLDNQWRGGIKQNIGGLYAKIAYKPFFNYAFVAGEKQKQFALKMGFNKNNILKGVYSADTPVFETINANLKAKVFIFVGRYVNEKGIENLCKAFLKISSQEAKDWQLWCIGKGDYKIPEHPQIKDFGFQQPHELLKLMESASVFVLPSIFEPWGVVVHEFVAAGFPIITSNKVGANELFLVENKNGFLSETGNQTDLENQLKKVCSLSQTQLQEMSNFSKSLAKKHSPKLWAQTLFNLIK